MSKVFMCVLAIAVICLSLPPAAAAEPMGAPDKWFNCQAVEVLAFSKRIHDRRVFVNTQISDSSVNHTNIPEHRISRGLIQDALVFVDGWFEWLAPTTWVY